MAAMAPSTGTVLALLFTLVVLVALLIFLYRKLNKETHGEYTVQRIVYKQGGVRDQVRRAAIALETRLGIQLWPYSDSEDDGEEMQDVEANGSCRSYSEGDEALGEEDEEDGNNTDSCGRENADEGSSLKESEAHAKLKDEPAPHEEKVEEIEDKQDKVKGAELLIDLNNLSGSAIWSEEHNGMDMGATGTVL